MPSSPIPNLLDLSISTIQSTPPQLQSAPQKNTPNIPSDYLGSTPTSEQRRKNPFNLPTSTQRVPHWMTHAFTESEPNLVDDPIEISSDTSLSLPETLSLPSTPSISQTPTTSFCPNFSTNLDNRYIQHLTKKYSYD